jgi:tRNA (cmo5U34)-methyltransferase
MAQTSSPVVFDEQQAAAYDERFARLAPLRDSLHLLAGLVLESLPADAHVLCVGAGTGLELLAFAQRFPQWRFTAVEPSGPMLAICRRRAEANGIAARCAFHHGFLHELPEVAAFDAATALLVSQFLPERDRRVQFFRDMARRLRPEGWMIAADLSAGELPEQYASLMELHCRMMRFSGVPEEKLEAMRAVYGREVAVLPCREVEAIIRDGGFHAPMVFVQHLLIHGWYARKAKTKE